LGGGSFSAEKIRKWGKNQKSIAEEQLREKIRGATQTPGKCCCGPGKKRPGMGSADLERKKKKKGGPVKKMKTDVKKKRGKGVWGLNMNSPLRTKGKDIGIKTALTKSKKV